MGLCRLCGLEKKGLPLQLQQLCPFVGSGHTHLFYRIFSRSWLQPKLYIFWVTTRDFFFWVHQGEMDFNRRDTNLLLYLYNILGKIT